MLSPEQIAWHEDQRELGDSGTAQLRELLNQTFDGVVLDAGGGTGSVSAVLANLGCTPILLDLSGDMLTWSADLAAQLQQLTVQADMTQMPLRTASVDGVHAAYSIQNVHHWRKAVSEISRVVKVGGPVMVAWGNGSVDEMAHAVRSRYRTCLGTKAGVAAERAGLTGVQQADEVMQQHHCPLQLVQMVTGVQVRSIRQLLDRLAGNPFLSAPTGEQRRAVAATLSWAAVEVGDVDVPRTVTVGREYRCYRRIAAV